MAYQHRTGPKCMAYQRTVNRWILSTWSTMPKQALLSGLGIATLSAPTMSSISQVRQTARTGPAERATTVLAATRWISGKQTRRPLLSPRTLAPKTALTAVKELKPMGVPRECATLLAATLIPTESV